MLDLGVYTKNRNFRLAYSTKQGKKARLVPKAQGYESILLLESLASFVPPATPLEPRRGASDASLSAATAGSVKESIGY